MVCGRIVLIHSVDFSYRPLYQDSCHSMTLSVFRCHRLCRYGAHPGRYVRLQFKPVRVYLLPAFFLPERPVDDSPYCLSDYLPQRHVCSLVLRRSVYLSVGQSCDVSNRISDDRKRTEPNQKRRSRRRQVTSSFFDADIESLSARSDSSLP